MGVLVITLAVGEEMVIGSDVVVWSRGGRRVRLGVRAPATLRISRRRFVDKRGMVCQAEQINTMDRESPMIWVTIILGIIQALPQLITLINDIVSKLHGHSDQPQLEAHFHQLLGRWKAGTLDAAGLEQQLHALKAQL